MKNVPDSQLTHFVAKKEALLSDVMDKNKAKTLEESDFTEKEKELRSLYVYC